MSLSTAVSMFVGTGFKQLMVKLVARKNVATAKEE
jgi:hypothetical protein